MDKLKAVSKNDMVKAAIRDANRNGGFVSEYYMGTKNNTVSFNQGDSEKQKIL